MHDESLKMEEQDTKILNLFTVVRYPFKMPKLFYKLPPTFLYVKTKQKTQLFGFVFFSMLYFWEPKAIIITWKHGLFSPIWIQLNKSSML